MKILDIRKGGAIFMVMVFCASQKVSSAEGSCVFNGTARTAVSSCEKKKITQSRCYAFPVTYESTDSSKLSQGKNEKSITNTNAEEILLKTQSPASEAKSVPNRDNNEKVEKSESDKSYGDTEILNVSKKSFGSSFNFFNPFLPFSFFPFPLPNLKRDVFHVNSNFSNLSDERDKGISNRFFHKPEPVFLIDFAFDIREMPVNNKTSESNLSEKDSVAKMTPIKSFSMISKDSNSHQKMSEMSENLENEWSFFDDSPLLPPDMDEFLPKSDFLLFDFPFHKSPTKSIQRHKKDTYKPVMKSDLNFIIDVFDEALSRTKKEMERSVPVWNLMSNGPKNYNLEEKVEKGGFLNRLHQINRIRMHEQEKAPEKQLNELRTTKVAKRNSLKQHKNPFVLGKVVKVGEIHIDDDLPKNSKKRRSSSMSSMLGNKVNRGIRKTSIELIRMNEPLKSNIAPEFEELVPRQTNLNDANFNIHSEVIADGKYTENKGRSSLDKTDEKGKIVKKSPPLSGEVMKKAGEVTKELNEKDLEEREPLLEVFKAVGEKKVRPSERPQEGFKFVSHVPTNSAGDTSVREEDQISVSHKESNGTRGELNSVEENSVSFSRNGQLAQANVNEHGQNTLDRERRQANRNSGGPPENQQVADLNNLFLTVTLPTMFAFTMLLLICFFNLQVRGWLCMRLFRARELSVVEQDAENNRVLKARIHHET